MQSSQDGGCSLDLKSINLKDIQTSISLQYQDHTDKADDEVVGESDQPGGDEVVDRAPATAAQPSHVARLRNHYWKEEKTINLHTQAFHSDHHFSGNICFVAFISEGKNV